ncbi:MAG: S8 family serine peptidase [Opitutae bacterium]|nr:S8 family serine peptidase [Opitutae bacterium]
MREKFSYLLPLAAGVTLALTFLWLLTDGVRRRWPTRLPASVATAPTVRATPAPLAASAERAPDAKTLAKLKRLRQALADATARPDEAVLTFADDEAYRAFLARAQQAGLTIRGRLDAFRTVRVGYDTFAALANDLLDHAADYGDLGANYFVQIPTAPPKEERAAGPEVPLGDRLRAFLGVNTDPSNWGRGVTIAILDSGVQPDATLGQGRLRFLDLGLGTAPGSGATDGHGTAVAGLAAGAATDAPGVAPAADILSIRITGTDGRSDLFTLAQAIVAAVDAGARIVNVSLGAYGSSGVLTQAIDYANQRGVALVAAAGNDQAARLTWPAADARVISVGAVDALGQQVSFSNSGDQLKLTAPGYGVQAAWLDGQRVSFDGTSASAPIVAGAIAALMSQNPGMNAAQAAQALQHYSSDGGAPGADPAYGAGVLNLGWAMNRNDPARVDTAISSQYFDAATGQMEIVVQNRSGRAVSGLALDVNADNATRQFTVPTLAPGAIYTARLPVDQNRLESSGSLVFRAQLTNPPGLVDQEPANNRRASLLAAPKK